MLGPQGRWLDTRTPRKVSDPKEVSGYSTIKGLLKATQIHGSTDWRYSTVIAAAVFIEFYRNLDCVSCPTVI